MSLLPLSLLLFLLSWLILSPYCHEWVTDQNSCDVTRLLLLYCINVISGIKINFLFDLLYSFMESEENIVLLMSFLSFHRSTLSLTVIFSNIKTTRDFLFDYFSPLSGKTPPLCLLSFPQFLTLINISLIGCKTWS